MEWRENRAEIAAAQLGAFHDAPGQFRARLARGEEPMPDGDVVIRFAQGRFPDAWSADDTRRLRSAAQDFIRTICLRDGADHYDVLCAPRMANAETLKQNYHLLMGLLHPDRQDGASAAWPAGCAQRVNVAYAAVGDEASRREYDSTLPPRRPHPASPERSREARRSMTDARFARTLLVVSIAVAVAVVALMSVHEDEWSDRTLMDAAIVALRARPDRPPERPRFVEATLEPAHSRAESGVAAFQFIEPLMRRIRGEEPVAFVPLPAIVAPSQQPLPAAPRRPDAAIVASAAAAEPGPSQRIAQAVAPPKPAVSAQAAAIPPNAAIRPSNEDIDRLVVSLVSYYEAGDVDHLVDLMDAGFWRTQQARQSYTDFFRATRARRLRVERLTWDARPGFATARGEATVVAEYFDGNAAVERRVPVELDIGMRDGKPMITRLSLFPLAR